jgi:hypothetical protein
MDELERIWKETHDLIEVVPAISAFGIQESHEKLHSVYPSDPDEIRIRRIRIFLF